MSENLPNSLKFLFGGTAACMATCIVQPMDFIKTRMQTSGVGTAKKEFKNSFDVVKVTMAKEGILGFYNGLSAGVFRQATYATTRLGCFQYLMEVFTSDGTPPNFAMKAGLGMFSGLVGSFIGTPADVCLIRMMSDSRLPPNERRNYKHVFDALFRILKEEGFTTLFRGAIPTMGRAMVANAAQLSTYSQTKQMLLASGLFGDNIYCHFASSLTAGLVTTIASLPVDIAKTRIQNMKTIDGKPQYTGTIDVLIKVSTKEGVLALWKGFTPYFLRVGPHTIFTFIFLEQLIKMYRAYK